MKRLIKSEMKQQNQCHLRHKQYRRNTRQRRRGVTLILVAIGMTTFLACGALVLDYGALVADANQLQRAVDAAALAGASQLKTQTGADTGPAQALALRAASENDVGIGTHGNSNQSPEIWFDNNGHPTKITVRATSSRGFLFGLAMGYPNGHVTRQATAGIGACNSAPPTPPIVPLGITQTSFDAYAQEGNSNVGNPNPKFETLTLIRANKTTFVKDDLVAFDMRGPNSKSPTMFEQQLIGNDLPGRDFPVPTITPATYETTLNASINKQGDVLEDGLGQLFQRSANYPWNDSPIADPNNPWQTAGRDYANILNGNSPVDAQGHYNPRIMNLIVTPPNGSIVVGTDNLKITGYAPVYVQQVTEDPTTGDVLVTVGFLPTNLISSDSCGGSGGSALTGNRVVTLLD